MRSPDRYARSRSIANVMLLAALGAIAYLDYAVALDRSLIPVELDATVLAKRIAHEKHPGVDDMHFVELRMSDGMTRTLEVDAPVFAAIDAGDRVGKAGGERRLTIDTSSRELEPSSDARAMRILVALFFVPAAIAIAIRKWLGEVGS